MTVLLPELLMRKKFLILCGKSFEPFVSREELDIPEKFRFSLCMVEEFGEELKSWVIVADWSFNVKLYKGWWYFRML